jgi:hypothetical protein
MLFTQGGGLMKYLIIAGIVILLVVAALGVVGYRKSKKLFAEFTADTVAKLPLNKSEILELSIESLPAGAKYSFTFVDHDVETSHVAYEDGVRVINDLKKDEKPYIKYRYLKEDVPFHKVRGWALTRGYYDIELHLEK